MENHSGHGIRSILETKKMHVNFRKDWGYRCPICRQIILPTDDEGFILHPYEDRIFEVTPCPHLIWCNTDGNAHICNYGDWGFMFVRADVAQKIVKLIKEDNVVRKELRNNEIIITEEDISRFLKGKLDGANRISGLFANLPIIYERLLPPRASLYQYSYSEFSNIEFAIEGLL